LGVLALAAADFATVTILVAVTYSLSSAALT
jgi:hypothetical protein